MAEVLKQWLTQHGINTKNFGRDFSNGMIIARLLKTLFPKLVEMHNYRSISNTPEKLNNWSTLNSKVLSKIGIQLTPEVIWQLVQGNPEFVIWLLNSIMHKTFFLKTSQKSERLARAQKLGDDSMNEFNMANKMYKQMLDKVQNKIRQLEGSLSTIDEVYREVLDKCYIGLCQQMTKEFGNGKFQPLQAKSKTKEMRRSKQMYHKVKV